MKNILKNTIFKKIFRPRYRVPNGIRKNKYNTGPPTIEELEFAHEIISKKRKERSKLNENAE